ncbi:uncharacterized protein LOC113092669 [Carassius auratus]|uniref:Uncharacterized protein LOC113092669 n=1 Tax=Carassius auratus TaxID=7957 RepID=A0A6P6P088_CARAU|nr:uncharacterized protein LOC113092669 [Carassius auratus]
MDMRYPLILAVLLALIRDGKGQTPTVLLRPNFPQVYVGDDVTLICNREGGSKPTTWYHNEKPQQSYQDYTMLLTAVTPENNGSYTCEQGGLTSVPFTLIVLELEPHAQLSPSVGGAVMTKGDGRNLVLQTDDDLKDWACYVLRGVSTFVLGLDINKEMKRAVIFAELKEAERATFWCKKKKALLRSNAVTLKMTELLVMLVPPAAPVLQGEPVALRCVVWGGPKLENVVFYKNQKEIISSSKGTYDINNATQDDNGKYSCHATYSYSHISTGAARKEGDSDLQELKVIGGPAAAVISGSAKSLQCSCPRCPKNCTSYHWYHKLSNDQQSHTRLSENGMSVTPEEEGEYSCRFDCGNGFSRFSDSYSYKAPPQTVNVMPIMIAVILIVLGLLIVLLIALKRRSGGSDVQASKRDKDKTTGGEYEQIQLKDKDQAVYHTLGESTGKEQVKDEAEGGYEALQKKQEEGVYHTLGQGEGQGEGQGGYEALKNVKAEVYQTLSTDDTKKTEKEAEEGYEQPSQKNKDYETVTVEENPYEEVKKQMDKEKNEETQ